MRGGEGREHNKFEGGGEVLPVPFSFLAKSYIRSVFLAVK